MHSSQKLTFGGNDVKGHTASRRGRYCVSEMKRSEIFILERRQAGWPREVGRGSGCGPPLRAALLIANGISRSRKAPWSSAAVALGVAVPEARWSGPLGMERAWVRSVRQKQVLWNSARSLLLAVGSPEAKPGLQIQVPGVYLWCGLMACLEGKEANEACFIKPPGRLEL